MAKPIPTTAIRYIGKKPFADRLYGSGLDFEPNQVREVPSELARSFLKHADLFEKVEAPQGELIAPPNDDEPPQEPPEPTEPQDDTAELLALQAEKDKAKAQDENALQDLFVQVSVMDKNALEQFAKDRYQVDLNKRKSVENLREEVIGLINQFGAL